MTRPFETGELFASSNFLVFANRCFAVAITLALQLALPARNPGGGAAPLYVFALSSFSNVVSSMSQYAAQFLRNSACAILRHPTPRSGHKLAPHHHTWDGD